ncbi:methyltransferase [Pararhodobacter sp. SW119]|uniref:tRNA1(Val) (adenine(37)-N6)-methyltransferase n=1 Tax=Pararhodobacter sp. SW119 TaxID=2780075 RepID=UPI001ADF2168|nr:methyltransferase [Pararhodobacter sp. SW119]
MGFSAAELSRDAFLGGRVEILQPRSGYRASTDPVLLAAAVAARPGQSALELGCGAGVALLSLGCRVPDLQLVGVERQVDYAELARLNAAENGIPAVIWHADLTRMPPELRTLRFDHVMANPPFHPPTATPASDPGRDGALREATPLSLWIDAGLRRVNDGGYLTLIHRAERLPEILSALQGRVGAVAVRPLAARTGRAAGRVLVQARKGARAPFRLLAPLILHAGLSHTKDGDDFASEARAILRDAAALDWN